MSCCSKLGDIIKKVINALKPILVVALLCVAAYFLILAPAGSVALFQGYTFLPTFVTSLSLQASTWGYLALGAAVMVDPSAVGEIAGNAAEAVGKVAGTVVAAAAGGVASGLFGGSNGWFFAAIGAFLVYKLFIAKDDDEEEEDAKEKEDAKEESPPSAKSSRDSGAANPPLSLKGS